MSSKRRSFATPGQVVAFVKECARENDAQSLYGACSEETSDFWKERILQDLRDIEQAETLERVFLQDGRITSFPAEAETFKLGGHDVRTKCLHIDLERLEGRWYLSKIWKCR